MKESELSKCTCHRDGKNPKDLRRCKVLSHRARHREGGDCRISYSARHREGEDYRSSHRARYNRARTEMDVLDMARLARSSTIVVDSSLQEEKRKSAKAEGSGGDGEACPPASFHQSKNPGNHGNEHKHSKMSSTPLSHPPQAAMPTQKVTTSCFSSKTAPRTSIPWETPSSSAFVNSSCPNYPAHPEPKSSLPVPAGSLPRELSVEVTSRACSSITQPTCLKDAPPQLLSPSSLSPASSAASSTTGSESDSSASNYSPNKKKRIILSPKKYIPPSAQNVSIPTASPVGSRVVPKSYHITPTSNKLSQEKGRMSLAARILSQVNQPSAETLYSTKPATTSTSHSTKPSITTQSHHTKPCATVASCTKLVATAAHEKMPHTPTALSKQQTSSLAMTPATQAPVHSLSSSTSKRRSRPPSLLALDSDKSGSPPSSPTMKNSPSTPPPLEVGPCDYPLWRKNRSDLLPPRLEPQLSRPGKLDTLVPNMLARCVDTSSATKQSSKTASVDTSSSVLTKWSQDISSHSKSSSSALVSTSPLRVEQTKKLSKKPKGSSKLEQSRAMKCKAKQAENPVNMVNQLASSPTPIISLSRLSETQLRQAGNSSCSIKQSEATKGTFSLIESSSTTAA
ncbi:hypothetical protein EGW08_003501, partial [Elysia chlorotica]